MIKCCSDHQCKYNEDTGYYGICKHPCMANVGNYGGIDRMLVETCERKEKGERRTKMIEYIYEMCKKHHCSVDLRIGPDGAMSITVFGKQTDFLIIRADWSEDTMKGCIDDVIRRACDD